MKEKLVFESKPGKRSAVLSNPSDAPGSPMVILCHGFATHKDTQTYMKLEQAINLKKIATFRFDFFGHGESDGKFEDITISKAGEDILSAISFLKTKGYPKIGLFGSSFGGGASIIAASKTPSMFALALKSPASDFLGKLQADYSQEELKQWKTKGSAPYSHALKLNYTFYKDALASNPINSATKVDVPTLIVHGSDDEIVPLSQSERLSKLIPDCRLEVIQAADHRYTNPEHFNRMLTLVSEFFDANSS